MMKLIETEKFIKKARKLVENNNYLCRKLDTALEKPESNPFDKSLNTHKLKGNFAGLYSSSVTGDNRKIFDFVENEG